MKTQPSMGKTGPPPVKPERPPRLCLGCDAPLERSNRSAWCPECMSPLQRLDFPEYYRDLGEVD